MSSYIQNNIKLQEAMIMELKQNVRAWKVPGLHVEDEDIPKNANFSMTCVMKFPDGRIQLVITWTGESDKFTHTGVIAEVSKLEELQEKFPHLFEMDGTLYAFA